MGSSIQAANRRDARLWVVALGLSLLANGAVIAIAGLLALNSHVFLKPPPPPASVPAETVITLILEAAPPAAPVAAEIQPASERRFARTTEDQRSDRPSNPRFIGERDTRATSDRSPDASARELPSQAGLEPRNPEDFETTESDFEDGELSSEPASQAALPTPAVPPSPPGEMETATPAVPGEKTDWPESAETLKATPAREASMDGPNPVDIPVARETSEATTESTPPERPKDGDPDTQPPETAADLPKPAAAQAVNDPAFRGFQQKRAISGSISRTGRSALDVADTPLGRYQMAISRTVEREWQRNCVRHRDFITPGFLTVRFFVEPSGKVKSVSFVGEMETGEIQKGFTLNSIRDANLPAMPAALAKEFATEPLEIIFNFYF